MWTITNASYTYCVEGSFTPEAEELIGSEVCTTYNDPRFKDRITGNQIRRKKKLWSVKFEDGYRTLCTRKKLKSLLPKSDFDFKRGFKQIDHRPHTCFQQMEVINHQLQGPLPPLNSP